MKTPKGITSSIAYEDILLRTNSPLTRSLMEGHAVHSLIQTDAESNPQDSDPHQPPIEDELTETNDEATPVSSDALLACSVALLVPDKEFDGSTDGSPVAMDDEPAPFVPNPASRDIGHHTEGVEKLGNISGESLRTDRQHILSDIREQIGSKKVSAAALSFAPSWILEEAF